MKNSVLVMLALFFLIPALGNAGNVSSRYDVTFGGYVKYDFGYNTQNQSSDIAVARRESGPYIKNLADEYGNTYQTAAETRFNFLVKGPELWGAKTSAFIEGDFRGVSTGNSYGGFQLRHAFMNLKWQSADLMIGQNWQQWGMPYYPAMISLQDFAQYLKGIRTPQIAFRYFFTKEFNVMAGLTSATTWYGAVRQHNDDYARSSWPGLQGEIAYWSDRCGRIGPNNLKFGLGGYYGKEKKITPAAAASSTGYHDDTLDAWLTAFRYSIPIIPEKQSNKAMALLLNGNFFYGQNVAGNNWFYPGGASNGSYWRNQTTYEGAAPTVFGLYTQASFWFTNNLWMNTMYGYLKYNYSAVTRDAMPNNVNMMQTYALNLLWDANPSVRFGLQWMNIFTGYNYATVANGKYNNDRTGVVNQFKFAAWYFF
ncbi:MAG: hypothetical protein PHT96_11775 [Syntrophorhabdaceae bacterium]|nr:hypothetical protein [Syntrophorhabdaceae bacterium]MDD4197063.1 hypothetical protein [Syntrophorhabdaceae bacterium]